MKYVFQAILALVGFAAILATGPAEAQSQYQVRPGDVLQIVVLEDPDLNTQALVLPDGRVSVPLAGAVQAAGRTLSQVEQSLSAALAPNFAVSPSVFVSVAGLAPDPAEQVVLNTIYIMGEIGSPGQREVPEGTTLLQALAEAGSFSRFAATRRIQLRRTDASGQERIILFDYQAVDRGAMIASMVEMRDGDVIIVPERRLFE